MNGFGGGFGGGPGGGFDWNGNGHRDIGDSYIDYDLSNGSGGGSGKGSSGGGGGCLEMFLGSIGGVIVLALFLVLLGSCS